MGGAWGHKKCKQCFGLKPSNDGGLQHRWEDKIKIDLREMGIEVVQSIHLAQVKVR
jgi:hypothetical protein